MRTTSIRRIAIFAPFALVGLGVITFGRSAIRARRSDDDVDVGRRIFEQRCAVCHATGARAAQGPGLGGVVGRKAASTRFGYSRALREADLTWDRATLERFLASPSRLVQGTTMPIAIPDEAERRAVVDYLATLAAGDALPEAVDGGFAHVPPAPPGLRTGQAALGDFRGDGPGVRRHITIADLPPPFATRSARNGPDVVPPPPGASPDVPSGFRVDVFARDLAGPRLIRVSPSGDLFVAESEAGRIRMLRAADGAASAEQDEVFAAGLDKPFGIAFYPPGPEPKWVYVAQTNAVIRFPYQNGDTHARGGPETIVPSLTKASGGHWTRDVAFSGDGTQMFVSVGSESNVAEGSAEERDRADVLVFDPNGEGHGGRHVFASGIRNCVGLAVHATTGDLWCATNERDGLGDDLVPDYVTRVRRGGFYGWPWYYLGNHQDPRHAGEHPELAPAVVVPDVLLQSHSAPLEMAFYDATAFPPKYRGCAFVSLHGSWNRAKRTGPKVVAVPLQAGAPTFEYEDFMTGFVVGDDAVWARPVGVAVARDGSLFVSEDGNGTVWRISYDGK